MHLHYTQMYYYKAVHFFNSLKCHYIRDTKTIGVRETLPDDIQLEPSNNIKDSQAFSKHQLYS